MSGARFNIADLPPHMQAQARAQLEKTPAPVVAPGIPKVAPVAKPMIRQHKGDGMNKWEREYSAILDIQWSHIYREVSLPLANGLKYKLDFLCVSNVGDTPAAIESKIVVVAGYEVKGRRRSTGIAKIKMAARLYPWIKFTLATKKRKKDGGGWTKENVLP